MLAASVAVVECEYIPTKLLAHLTYQGAGTPDRQEENTYAILVADVRAERSETEDQGIGGLNQGVGC